MKNIPISLLLISLSIPCFGQIEWVDNYGWTDGIETFNITCQGHHVINYGYFPPTLVAVDDTGNEIFRFSESSLSPGTYFVDISDIIELADSSIAFPKVSYSIDGGGNGNFNFVTAVVDKNWQNLSYCWNGITNTDMAPRGNLLSDNSLVLYDVDYFKAKRLSDECQPVWENNIDFQIFDMTVTSDDRMVWAGDNGLTVMEANGDIDTVYSNILFGELQSTSFDGILGLRQDSIFLLSPEFEPLESRGFPDDSILDFSVAHNKLAVLTENKMVYLFSDSLVFQNSFELTDESEFQLIDIGSEGLGLAGLETYGSTMPSGGTEAFFTKSYSFSGDNYDMSRDIGIVDVQLGEVSHVTVDPIFPNQFRVYFNDAAVTVENFGDETVSDFFIRSRSSLSGLSQKFEGAALAPNGSVTLALDGFWVRSEVEPGGMESICLWTSHPDKRLDEDSTNDGLCTDFLVNDAEQALQAVFEIYPNPAQQGSTVYFNLPDKGGASVQVFDSMGRQVWSNRLGENSGTLHLPQYPAGIYYVTLSLDGEPVRTVKFVQF